MAFHVILCIALVNVSSSQQRAIAATVASTRSHFQYLCNCHNARHRQQLRCHVAGLTVAHTWQLRRSTHSHQLGLPQRSSRSQLPSRHTSSSTPSSTSTTTSAATYLSLLRPRSTRPPSSLRIHSQPSSANLTSTPLSASRARSLTTSLSRSLASPISPSTAPTPAPPSTTSTVPPVLFISTVS